MRRRTAVDQPHSRPTLPNGENRVVVVKETKYIEVEGAKREVVIVQGSDGKTEQIEVAREDTPENSKNLEGSVLADGDKTTPGVDSEVED